MPRTRYRIAGPVLIGPVCIDECARQGSSYGTGHKGWHGPLIVNFTIKETEMPTITFPNLTLTTVNNLTTTIRVTYTVEFTEFERSLAGLGMNFHDHIDVYGVDGSVDTLLLADPLPNFGTHSIAVTAGAGTQRFNIDRSIVVARSLLQEDTAVGDSDEIRCKVRIHSVGMPPELTPDAFTDLEVIAN